MLSIKSLWAAILRRTNDFFYASSTFYTDLDPVASKLSLELILFLFSVYLVTQGVNPREHGIKQELVWMFPLQLPPRSLHFTCVYVSQICFSNVHFLQERIRLCMNRVKEITEKKKAARLDKGAAARFVRSALYEPEDKDDRRKSASKKKAEGKSDTPPSKLLKRRWNAEVVV